MNSPFKISIITVTKNAEKTIGVLFDSIRKFKANEVEFIVLDAISTDSTLALIKQNEDIIDYWKSEKDSGIYDAMNKAVKIAKGNWLIFIGADDELLEGFNLSISLLNQPKTIYYGKVFFHGLVFSGKIKDDYTLTKTNICHQAIFYPKSVFAKYKYQEEYIVCADYVLNLNCWNDPEFEFVYIDQLISNYAIGGYSGTIKDNLFEANKSNLFKQHLNAWAYFRYSWKKLKNLYFKKNG
ncbi:glycosyltransferase [Pedobacter mucosus]|uniref:glycosyltransferase n=1 Tax=Pedobacter mucosus TaxID=2895286 RepID=UPI001EE4421F|nr:glycosyltransferase [Pedobacter mucosus]UKT63816.1 glycosyltransferase [Pedobacter mucosus]